MFPSIKISLVLSLVLAGLVRSKVEVESYKEDTRKCCWLNEVLVEEGPGTRECRTVDNVGHPNLNHMVWRNKKLSDYAMFHQSPECGEREELVALYHHGEYQGRTEKLDLTPNGTLTVSINGREKMEFSTDKYCIDKLLMSHDFSHILEGDVANFAYVCMNIEASISEIVSTVVYPIGVAVSMSCLTLTFLLYSLLPQLRDLTGKFILGICTFLTANYALRLIDVEMFGSQNVSIEELGLDLIQHSCNVGKIMVRCFEACETVMNVTSGAWLCLNSMGHQVWKVIRSKSVFTRVTDGQRCCYYSIYVSLVTSVITALAVSVHFLIDSDEEGGKFKVGSASLAIFYAPVVFLLIINVYFWWTSTRQIGKQLVYNRSMQHFQTNFDLFTKLFMVIGACWFFQTLALLDIRALDYIGKIFTLIQVGFQKETVSSLQNISSLAGSDDFRGSDVPNQSHISLQEIFLCRLLLHLLLPREQRLHRASGHRAGHHRHPQEEGGGGGREGRSGAEPAGEGDWGSPRQSGDQQVLVQREVQAEWR